MQSANALVGKGDPVGIPGAQHAGRVVVVPGETHALKGHRAAIAAAVADWLPAGVTLGLALRPVTGRGDARRV